MSTKVTQLALKNAGRKYFIAAGLPMIGFLIGGTYVLSTFMQTHYELKDKGNNSKSQRKFDLEEEHNKLIKSLDIDNYSLSRIPRPEDLETAARERELKRLKRKETPSKESIEVPIKKSNSWFFSKPVEAKPVEAVVGK